MDSSPFQPSPGKSDVSGRHLPIFASRAAGLDEVRCGPQSPSKPSSPRFSPLSHPFPILSRPPSSKPKQSILNLTSHCPPLTDPTSVQSPISLWQSVSGKPRSRRRRTTSDGFSPLPSPCQIPIDLQGQNIFFPTFELLVINCQHYHRHTPHSF
ncbi:uncharacterized protein EI90DRAFT_1414511 [Cantharellus anzutake]|uniref:uncharacterized protein n=1 Tax=Cantharellus anzutake TaxID=1750568 RepID=UPI0019057B60|nr:uncharacterized protein EI90DRAFT_1414511 [Cantharellus anzutake]KAF8329576.1 hypothetical protein EI90DRAFT_1414511 [Cantharellus anzutake]